MSDSNIKKVVNNSFISRNKLIDKNFEIQGLSVKANEIRKETKQEVVTRSSILMSAGNEGYFNSTMTTVNQQKLVKEDKTSAMKEIINIPDSIINYNLFNNNALLQMQNKANNSNLNKLFPVIN